MIYITRVSFVLFRAEITQVIISIVDYSNKFAAYSNSDSVMKLLDSFVRDLYVWRQPFPKFRQSKVSKLHLQQTSIAEVTITELKN